MPLTYSQWIWGFEIFDSTVPASQNNQLDFTRTAGTNPPNPPTGAVTAFLNAGVYTPDELATEIARAMNAVDPNQTGTNVLPDGTRPEYVCTFSYSTLRFTITNNETSPASFTLARTAGQKLWNLAGFANGSPTSGTSQASDAPVGSTPSSASIWTAAEPLVLTSPVAAQSAGSPALLTQRTVNTRQNISDGASIESVYVSTLKSVQIAFRALLPAEQTNMEQFLNWAVTGKRFTWQPDKTSTNVLKLVLANPAQITNTFEWLTRSETGYGTLTFFEQL